MEHEIIESHSFFSQNFTELFVTAIILMAGAFVYVHRRLEKKIDECERDRTQLWNTLHKQEKRLWCYIALDKGVEPTVVNRLLDQDAERKDDSGFTNLLALMLKHKDDPHSPERTEPR